MNRVRVLALQALAIVALVACSSGAATPPSLSSGRGSEIPSATPWDTEIASLQMDGTRTLDSALRLMAMAFGPIPGVDAATAAPGAVGSASPAVRVVRDHLDRLTSEQRAAVDRYLQVRGDSRTFEISANGGMLSPTSHTDPLGGALLANIGLAGRLVAAAYPYDDFDREIVEDATRIRTQAARYFGEVPVLRIRTTFADDEPLISFFNPTIGEGGVEACDVIVNRTTANIDRFSTRRAISLDVVHCFQSYAMGSEAGFLGQVPAWAWEGPAEYITLEEWPPTETDGLAWSIYFANPDAPLFGRSYDAVGYYAQALAAGVDLSDAFRAVLTDVDNPERFALAETTSNRFLDSWAPGLAQADWGGEWIFTGPGFPTNRPQAPSDPIIVENGSNEAVSQAPYSNHLYVIDARADLVRMDFNGRARVGDGTTDLVLTGPVLFCVSDDGCESDCPSGAVLPVDRVPLRPDALLAVSGGTDGTSGFISGTTLVEECSTPQPPPSDPDEFCRLWRSYLEWAEEEDQAGHELDRALAAAIVMQFQGMRPYAPADLADDVDAVIDTYTTFAEAPEPFQVPLSGLDADAMYAGLLAIDAHCGTNKFTTP